MRFILGLSVVLLACGPAPVEDPELGDGDGEKSDTCNRAEECIAPEICNPATNQCESNLTCIGHDDCGLGAFCSAAGICEHAQTGTPCFTDGQCLSNETCFGAVETINEGTCGCNGDEHVAEPVEPNILLVVDRSSSMSGSGWTGAKQAVTSIANTFGGNSNLGLALFPSSGDCNVGGASPSVGPQHGPQVISRMNSTPPSNEALTPITAQFEYLAANNQFSSTPQGQDAIVFMTDGGESCSGSTQETEAAVQSLRNDGVITFAIAYGTNSGYILDKIATAGGTGSAYIAPDATSLGTTLENIVGSVIPCRFTVEDMPEGDVFVLADGQLMDSGFTYDSSTGEVVFDIATCDSMRINGVSSVNVLSGCEVAID